MNFLNDGRFTVLSFAHTHRHTDRQTRREAHRHNLRSRITAGWFSRKKKNKTTTTKLCCMYVLLFSNWLKAIVTTKLKSSQAVNYIRFVWLVLRLVSAGSFALWLWLLSIFRLTEWLTDWLKVFGDLAMTLGWCLGLKVLISVCVCVCACACNEPSVINVNTRETFIQSSYPRHHYHSFEFIHSILILICVWYVICADTSPSAYFSTTRPIKLSVSVLNHKKTFILFFSFAFVMFITTDVQLSPKLSWRCVSPHNGSTLRNKM